MVSGTVTTFSDCDTDALYPNPLKTPCPGGGRLNDSAQSQEASDPVGAVCVRVCFMLGLIPEAE